MLGPAAGAGLVGAVAVHLLRARPLVAAEPTGESSGEGGGGKKDDKKDAKKKGSGPRTRRKKAKKGK